MFYSVLAPLFILKLRFHNKPMTVSYRSVSASKKWGDTFKFVIPKMVPLRTFFYMESSIHLVTPILSVLGVPAVDMFDKVILI